MCGGAIISDILPPSCPLRRLNVIHDMLWGRGLNENKYTGKYNSKPARSWCVVDFDHDLESEFKNYSDDHEVGFNVQKKSAFKFKTLPGNVGDSLFQIVWGFIQSYYDLLLSDKLKILIFMCYDLSSGKLKFFSTS